MTIDGDVVEFVYRAPHAWLYVMAADPQGPPQRYGAEWASPSRLERDGVAKDTFQAGDQVSVTGSPGRSDRERGDSLEEGDALFARAVELGRAAGAALRRPTSGRAPS